MPAPLRIILTPEEDLMLTELRLARTVPQRTRDRAHILRLNAQGWNVPAISAMFECHQHTIRSTIKRWAEHLIVPSYLAPGFMALRQLLP